MNNHQIQDDHIVAMVLVRGGGMLISSAVPAIPRYPG